MTKINFRTAALVFAAPVLAMAAPAAAAPAYGAAQTAQPAQAELPVGKTVYDQRRDRRGRYDRSDYGRYDNLYDRRDRYDDRYEQRVHRNTRVWRGRDGRYYCQKDNGTTGLLIGAGVGALIGHEVAGRGDRTLGAILGAAGGALLGRAIDKGNTRCR